MKSVIGFLVATLMAILFFTSDGSKKVHADVEVMVTPTISYPKVVFSVGYASSSGAAYRPREGEICALRYLGVSNPYFGPFNKYLMVIKFTSDAYDAIAANNVTCESASDYSPNERRNWYLLQPENTGYNLTNSYAIYVDGQTMAQVTLTSTPTQTPEPTSTQTATEEPSETPTQTEEPSSTPTETELPTDTPTPTATATVTSTPVLAADWELSAISSTIITPKKGDICWGRYVGKYTFVAVEFTQDYNSGVQIQGPGGCIRGKFYTLNDVMSLLKEKGLRYRELKLPEKEPTLTPTITVIPNLPIDWNTKTLARFRAFAGTICWGSRVGEYSSKVVYFTKDEKLEFWVANGSCYAGGKYSAEDIFNYLKRSGRPLSGIVNTP